MSIGSVSFWQQDYNYWHSDSFYSQDQNYLQDQRALDQQQSNETALFTTMGDSVTLQTTGLAQIATQEAQARVNKQIAADEAELNGLSGTGSSSSSTTPAGPAPATGTGTVPLTTSTPLSTLGILAGGTFSINDGTNITKYTSTGDDTVADLINAINSGPAFVTASINGNGRLVITARNTKDIVTVEGSGNDAAALGFGTGNNSFTPKTPASNASSSSTTSSSSAAAASSTGTSSPTTSSGSSTSTAVSTIGQEISSSAASILSASGVSGSLVDMLA